MSRHSKGTSDGPLGQVVPFPHRATLALRAHAPEDTFGRILLFTGIRYERHGERLHAAALPASAEDRQPAPAGAGRRGPRRRA
jgi:hypothetical protein